MLAAQKRFLLLAFVFMGGPLVGARSAGHCRLRAHCGYGRRMHHTALLLHVLPENCYVPVPCFISFVCLVCCASYVEAPVFDEICRLCCQCRQKVHNVFGGCSCVSRLCVTTLISLVRCRAWKGHIRACSHESHPSPYRKLNPALPHPHL